MTHGFTVRCRILSCEIGDVERATAALTTPLPSPCLHHQEGPVPRLDWLADSLRAAGLTVVEEPGWRERGRLWNPIAGMIHHTASAPPHPVEELYRTRKRKYSGPRRIKCNFNVKDTGVIHVIAAGCCSYATGPGSRIVLDEIRRDVVPRGPAHERDLPDDHGPGNLHFVNCEADHPGGGEAMPEEQERSIVVAFAAIFREMGLNYHRLIGHNEWTKRKVDPRWNGMKNRTPHLRELLAQELKL